MIEGECQREAELLDSLRAGECPDELRRHAGACERCADLYAVATALLDAGQVAVEEAPVRSSGFVWWRIQLRRRREAAEQSQRALVTVQAVSLIFALTLCFSAFGAAVLAGILQPPRLLALGGFGTPLLLGIGLTLLLVPFAIYFALKDEG